MQMFNIFSDPSALYRSLKTTIVFMQYCLILFILINSFTVELFAKSTKNTPNETISISSSAYLVHSIEKNQTLYRIGILYGVSVEELLALNPEAKNGIKTGEKLIIPINKNAVAQAMQTVESPVGQTSSATTLQEPIAQNITSRTGQRNTENDIPLPVMYNLPELPMADTSSSNNISAGIDRPSKLLSDQAYTKTITRVSHIEGYKLSALRSIYHDSLYKRIDRLLATYLPRESYLIDLELETETQLEEVYFDEVSGLESPEQKVDYLPGLPYVDQELFTTSEASFKYSLKRVSSNLKEKILEIYVTIFVDTTYNNFNREFTRLAVESVIKADDPQSTFVEVLPMPFPNQSFQSRLDTINIKNTEKIKASNASASNQTLLPFDPLSVFILLAGLLVFSILLALFIRPKSTQTMQPVRMESQIDNLITSRTLRDEEEKLDQPTTKTKQEEEPIAAEAYLSELIAEQSFKVARLFEQWIVKEGEDMLVDLARVLNIVDSKLVVSLQKSMNPIVYERLKSAVNQHRTINIKNTERNKLLKQVMQDLKEHISYYEGLPPQTFSFIDHLGNEELIELLQNEPSKKIILVMSMMKQHQVARYLNSLSSDKAVELMLKLPDAKKISFTEANEIATSLYEKMISKRNKSEHDSKDIQMYLNIIENLPIDKQSQYLEEIINTNSDVYRKIKEIAIFWENLDMLESDFLSNALQSISSETIAKELVNETESFKMHLLSSRPKRESLLIFELMSSLDISDRVAIDAARKALLAAVRKHKNETKQSDYSI